MQDMSLDDFSDEELWLLANLSDFEKYRTWIGREVFSARHHVDFQRLQQDPEVQKLMQYFKTGIDEKGISQDAVPALRVPSDPHVATRVAGKDHERTIDLQASISTCVFKWFTSMVTCQALENASGVECLSHDGQWKRMLYLVLIPESMVADGHVKGVRPSPRAPQWMPVSQLHQALTETEFPMVRSIKSMLQESRYSHQLCWQAHSTQAHLKVKFHRN